MRAVTIQDIWDVVPAIRDTSERDIDPLTGADPDIPATPQATPCATSSRGGDHAMPFSVSNPDAIPIIDKKLIAANRMAATIRAI